MKKNLFLLAMITICTAACSIRRPISKTKADNNKTYEVEYLFEHDGCRVYRFEDYGNYVYFTSCQGEAIKMTDSTAIRNTTKIKN